jgi:hypothetical protein
LVKQIFNFVSEKGFSVWMIAFTRPGLSMMPSVPFEIGLAPERWNMHFACLAVFNFVYIL